MTSWQGWDNITRYLPQSEMHDFVVELRSHTLEVGSFDWEYDHLKEVPDKLTDRILTSYSNGK